MVVHGFKYCTLSDCYGFWEKKQKKQKEYISFTQDDKVNCMDFKLSS